MTFTDEQMQEFDAAQALALGAPLDDAARDAETLAYAGVPAEYAHLTPSEQFVAVDADAREARFEREQREYNEWWG